MADVKIYTATKTDEVIAQAINSKGLNSVVTDVAVTEDGTGIKVVHSNGTETVVNFPAGGSVGNGLTQADIDSAIDALNLEQYALKSDIPAPQDLSKYALKSDIPAIPDLSSEVRAIVEGMDLGGGSGVREVSGTVTLTTADGPLVQVYATAAATVQGESLMAGDVAVFRLVAGEWEVRILDVDFEWRLIGTAPAPIDPNPDDGPIVVITKPDMVSFTDVDGSTKDSYTIPRVTGVLWEVSTNGGAAAAVQPGEYTPAAGATVKVIAVADSGYVISGPTEWTNTFSDEVSHEWATRAFYDTFTRPAGKLYDTTSDSGHLWVGSAYGTDKLTGSGTVTPSAPRANQGVKLWSGDISLRAKVLLGTTASNVIVLSIRASEDFGSLDGLNIEIEDRGDDTGRVVCTGIASVTFNQEGRMVNGKYENWSHVAGWTSGASKEFRIDILANLATVYVDGTKILEGAVNTSKTGEYLRLAGTSNVAFVDSLEAWT